MFGIIHILRGGGLINFPSAKEAYWRAGLIDRGLKREITVYYGKEPTGTHSVQFSGTTEQRKLNGKGN